MTATLSENVFLIGPRYQHHCRYSGYEHFGSYCARMVRSPVRTRSLTGRLGKLPRIGDLGRWIDAKITDLVGRPLYTFGIFMIEASGALHMLTHRKTLYHVLYGDTDYWLLGFVRRWTNNKLIATFHEPDYGLDWLEIHRITPFLDAAVLVSESQREYFEKLLPPERIFVAPHGIDPNFFTPAEKLCKEPVGITVGTHHRDPGSLSRALDIILKEYPNFRLKAVGARLPGGGNPPLTDERVEYYDGISDLELREHYRSSAVAVFSLNQATANNALLEAMACGLPVVATDIGGVRETVGDAAILSRHWDGESLAQGVIQVLRDRNLAERLGRAARQRVLQFDYPRVAEYMRSIYGQVLGQRAHP